MKKLFYTLNEFIYVVVLCSRSFQQFPECRRSTEGSTKGHYTDWALAHHITLLLLRGVRVSFVRASLKSCREKFRIRILIGLCELLLSNLCFCVC
jgi:hypothetical protein